MRIRLKLTILLLVFSFAPLVVSEVIDAIAFERLSAGVDRQVADNISRRVEQELAVHVRRTAEQMGGMRDRVMMMTRAQASVFADALSEAAPPPGGRVFRPADLDGLAQGEIPPGYREQPGWPLGSVPPVVNYERPVFIAPAGADQEPLELISRLAGTTPELDALSTDLHATVRGQFLGMPDGAHLSYPAKGGYAGFDPRTRSWYALGAGADGIAWIGPYDDAITGEPRMTCVAPVRAPDGTLLGVTGVDLALSNTLDFLELPAELALGSSAWVIAVDDEGGSRVLISTRGGASDSPAPADRAPGRADTRFVDDIAPELRQGIAGSRRIELAGEPGIAAYGPIAPGTSLVMTVADHRIDSLISGVRQDLRAIARESTRSLIAVSALVLLLCFAGAYVMGRTVSRPIRRLADAAQAVSEGDMTARVSIRSRGDELGKLARTFNDMVPALADRMRLQESVALANELQVGMLPSGPPAIPGFDVFGIAVYCDETGGDYFDYLEPISLGENRHGLALGDVTGHGIPAALIMTSARALLLSHARHTNKPNEILNRINETIARNDSSGRFMTFTLLVLDTRARTLEIANAGHDPALVLRKSTGSFEELALGGLPLGIVPEETYSTATAGYPEAGDVLLIGTDGIWETRDPRGELFGKERMREIVRTNADRPAKEIGDAILEALKTFRGAAPVLDDITFIIAKADGPA